MTSVFHEGELAVQALAGEAMMAERNGAIIAPRILRGALPFLEQQSMAVLAYADGEQRVWVSPLFGRRGFVQSPDGFIVHIDLSRVAMQPHDPLWSSIGNGTPAGMLVIELANRRRVRINGDLFRRDEHSLKLAVRESYPNCPKYITRRSVRIATTGSATAQEFSEGIEFGKAQVRSVNEADVLFIGTVHPERGLDASHRGGSPGFIQVLDSRTLRIPDYLGNSMFNTLGNLAVDARAGIAIPDFTRGSLLRLSGNAETLWNQPDETGLSGGTYRFLHFHVERWNQEALPSGVQTEFFDYSPFNPTITLRHA